MGDGNGGVDGAGLVGMDVFFASCGLWPLNLVKLKLVSLVWFCIALQCLGHHRLHADFAATSGPNNGAPQVLGSSISEYKFAFTCYPKLTRLNIPFLLLAHRFPLWIMQVIKIQEHLHHTQVECLTLSLLPVISSTPVSI